ncbi:hypothetical protein R3P38DRAFT_3313186 [Favolaschia claudopus]|uniref:Uncharacterized protein n=1 Tax=Favolaschia claudopus TaxID=2862362 RepID=A0AAW0C3F7_9AGAR
MLAQLALPLIAVFAASVFASPVSIAGHEERLAVLQEMAKRIITETICEVETQTIVFEQYFQSLGHFRGDLRRHSGHKVGHDRGVVSHFGKIFNPDGSICTDDWHFTGHDIGSQTVVIKDNWNEVSSPRSVDSAFFTARCLLASFFALIPFAQVGFSSISTGDYGILSFPILPAMFGTFTVLFLFSLLSLTSVAKPLSFRREQTLMLRDTPSLSLQARANVSFDSFDNIPQLQGFDEFNGNGNFNGRNNDQKIVIKEVEKQCEVVKIEVVQQKLAILQEIAKRIITEQICDVQVQTIVLEQHNGVLQVFRDDIQRKTVTRQVGYDEEVASKLTNIIKADGTLSVDDNGFSGTDIGKNLVVPQGNNWDDTTGPTRVQSALDAARSALNSTSTQ